MTLTPQVRAATSLFPDLTVRVEDLYDHDVVTTVAPGRRHLRLSVGTPNIGAGPLQIYGVLPDNGDGTQNVDQRVFDDAGGYTDFPAGVFVYHPQHHHVHLEGWSEYRIRTILPGNGVGPIVATGGKTSFCLLDKSVYDSHLPGFSPTPAYTQCAATTQGISVGWADVYDKTLEGQNIDVTDVPDGTYWLEVEVDPNHEIREANESNNIARIEVVIGQPAPINADRYEPNDSLAAARSRTAGAPNSPNLGPTAPLLQIDSLTVDTSGNDDWFRFFMAGMGQPGDEVDILFFHSLGDLDLELYDESGVRVRKSNGTVDNESIPLDFIGPGWFSVRVLGYNGATSPNYSLRIKPPVSDPPTITVSAPPAGDTMLHHGTDSYAIHWASADPDGHPVWISVYLNTQPVLDGSEFLAPGMTNLDGTLGGAVINSAEIPDGTWWVYCSATDGGTVTGGWSSGTVTFVDSLPPPPPVYSFQLTPPRPNPVNAIATMSVELSRPERVRWDILDARGRVVRTFLDEALPAGPHAFPFDATDDRGQRLPSGIYFSRVATSSGVRGKKFVVLR